MRLSNIDIRHLRVLLAVVECGGFTAAEDVLGLGQSTISTHIGELEQRVGFRICERGRAGFSLTERGEELYAAALRLVDAFTEFEDRSQTIKGKMAGRLRLGIIDNIVSDPTCPILHALSELGRDGRGPRISIEVLSPSEIEYAIAAGKLDLGISIAEKYPQSLRYTPLYNEIDVLVCGDAHPLFCVEDEEELRQEIRYAPKVIRSFLNHHDFFLISDREDTITATVSNVEAAAMLILAGTHIGFIPDHYAAPWIEKGNMRVMLQHAFSRTSEMALIEPVDRERSQAVELFAKIICDRVAADTSVLSMGQSKQRAVS